MTVPADAAGDTRGIVQARRAPACEPEEQLPSTPGDCTGLPCTRREKALRGSGPILSSIKLSHSSQATASHALAAQTHVVMIFWSLTVYRSVSAVRPVQLDPWGIQLPLTV